MNSVLHRLVTAGVLVVWGTVFAAIYFTGRIASYLHPAFHPFALAAGVVLVVFALLVLVSPRLDGGCGPSPDRSSVGAVLLALALVVPLLVAFFASPDSFGANMVRNRTYVQDVSRLPTTARPTVVEPALPDEVPPSDEAAEGYSLPRNAKGDIQAEVIDILYAAQIAEMRPEFENKSVEVVGQLMPARGNNPTGDRYDLIRMFMTCCAADVQPIALPVQPTAKPDFPEMTWVKVSGTLRFPIVGGQSTPILENGVIEKTDPPPETFLY